MSKDMTWTEFCAKAKEYGALDLNDYEILFKGVVFSRTGCVSLYMFNMPVIVRERTKEQMLMIMEVLR